jgi:hypothetical protein
MHTQSTAPDRFPKAMWLFLSRPTGRGVESEGKLNARGHGGEDAKSVENVNERKCH